VDKCPVCHGYDNHEFSRDKKRIYYLCNDCSLVFVPRNLLIATEEEKKRYESHDNSNENTEYRAYLTKIADSIEPLLLKGTHGLDFGSGKTTLFSDLLKERGFQMSSYDLYFHPNEEIWSQKFDFIVLSEVIEHVRDPHECLEKIKSLLNSAGQLFIKTKFYPPDKKLFDDWFYKRDMTHVQFFNRNSLNQLAKTVGFNGSFKMIGEDLYRIVSH
jgi:SAM-dependent methyltransferase